jgi:hypothetical protein
MEGILILVAAFALAALIERHTSPGHPARPVIRPAAAGTARRLLRALLGVSVLITAALVILLAALQATDVAVRLVHGLTTLGFWMMATLVGVVLALGPRPPRARVVAGLLVAAAVAWDVTSIDRFAAAFAVVGIPAAAPAAIVLIATSVAVSRRLIRATTNASPNVSAGSMAGPGPVRGW